VYEQGGWHPESRKTIIFLANAKFSGTSQLPKMKNVVFVFNLLNKKSCNSFRPAI